MMKSTLDIFNIIVSTPVRIIVKNIFHNDEIEIVERPASYIIRLKKEPEDKINRILLLPPLGFTANAIDETNPHPEARKAKIEIKGAIRRNKQSFSLLKNVIKYQYYTKRNISTWNRGIISQDWI